MLGHWKPPMSDSAFIVYVGDAEFHDGCILAVEQLEGGIRVGVRGYSGKLFIVAFSGVHAVTANRPEGMVLYALSELRCEPPLRRFVFNNWDDEDNARLEIDAEDFTVH